MFHSQLSVTLQRKMTERTHFWGFQQHINSKLYWLRISNLHILKQCASRCINAVQETSPPPHLKRLYNVKRRKWMVIKRSSFLFNNFGNCPENQIQTLSRAALSHVRRGGACLVHIQETRHDPLSWILWEITCSIHTWPHSVYIWTLYWLAGRMKSMKF